MRAAASRPATDRAARQQAVTAIAPAEAAGRLETAVEFLCRDLDGYFRGRSFYQDDFQFSPADVQVEQ